MEFCYIFYALIAIISWSGKVYGQPPPARRCDIGALHKLGLKVLCENENEEQISCYEQTSDLTAYIQCAKSYYASSTKSSQIVHCVGWRSWSEPLLECIPECEKYPVNMKPFDQENSKSFKWYIELVRKTPEAGKPSFFKGIILNERHVYTTDDFCSNYKPYVDKFVARTYKSGGDFKDYALSGSNTLGVGGSCIAFLDKSDYIRFNNDHKPVCSDSLDIGYAYGDTLNEYVITTKGCNISSYDTEKYEARCFENFEIEEAKYGMRKKDCSKSNQDLILKRCQLGYESQKPLTGTKNFYISRCETVRGLVNWDTEQFENDCVLTCGEVDKEYIPPATPLLFKGSAIETISAPWHVGIYEKKGDDIDQICGGTIIHTNIIISAAHCFYDESLNVLYSVSLYLVGAGKKYRSYDANDRNADIAKVKDIFIPPNYSYEKQQNDLAILILDRHFNYSSHIKPVCVDWKSYTNSDIPEGTIGRVVGWGATSANDEKSPKLQTISLNSLTRKQCERRVDPRHKGEITGDKFCAVNENNATACRGDSGGGFVVKKKYGPTERYVLAGIVSLGVDYTKYCADGFLTFFTNIQLYKDLIQEYISETRNIEYFNSDIQSFRDRYPYLP